jgi:hypothetical protein
MQFDALLRELGLRVDEDLPPALIKQISISQEAYRLELDQAGLRYDIPKSKHRPSSIDLGRTGQAAIDASVRSAGVVAALSGLCGAISVPPEAFIRIVQSFRLAQRLAIIYGHDPATDPGSLQVRRALSAAWEFNLPPQAKVNIKLTDLGGVIRSGLPAIHDGPAWMARTLAKTATKAVGHRFSRWVPGLGAGMGLLDGRRLARAQGDRMHNNLKKRWQGPRQVGVEEAVEIIA